MSQNPSGSQSGYTLANPQSMANPETPTETVTFKTLSEPTISSDSWSMVTMENSPPEMMPTMPPQTDMEM
eukprot:11463900-Karenia_brevis.AAC.1